VFKSSSVAFSGFMAESGQSAMTAKDSVENGHDFLELLI